LQQDPVVGREDKSQCHAYQKRHVVRLTYLVAQDLGFGVVFKVAISLESVFDELPELDCECIKVVQVVHPQTGSRRLAAVCWTDALLCGSDATAAQLYLLQAVYDLMEVEDEMRSVGDEESTVAGEAWERIRRISDPFF